MYKNIKFYFLNELLYLGYYLNMLPYLLNIIKRNSKTVFKKKSQFLGSGVTFSTAIYLFVLSSWKLQLCMPND